MLSGLWWFGTWISVNGNGKAWMVVMVLVRFPCRAVLCGGGDCINLFY